MLLRAPRTGLDEPVLLAFGQDAFLAAWDETEDVAEGPLSVFFDGTLATRRRASTRLRVADRTRFIVAARAPEGYAGTFELRRDGIVLARLALDAVEPDPAVLVEALEPAARARVLAFILGAVRSALRPESGRHARFCRELACAVCPGEPITALAKARLTDGAMLYASPAPQGLGAVSSVHILESGRVRDCTFLPALAASSDGLSLFLAAPPCGPSGADAVLIGTEGAAMLRLTAMPAVPPAAAAGALSPALKHYALRCLGALSDTPQAAATARALQATSTEPARVADGLVGAALEFACGCGDAGIFARGWIRDPHQIVERAEIVSPFGTADLATTWRRLPRPDLENAAKRGSSSAARPGSGAPGFIALAPVAEPLPVLQRRLRLSTPAGPVEATSAPTIIGDAEARDTVLGSVPAQLLDEQLLGDIIAPAAAALHARAMKRQGTPEVVEIGPQPAAPEVSFIIPLYRNLSFLRLQIGAFSADPELRRHAELVYVLDSPEQRADVEHLLRGLSLVTGLAFRLVVMSANFGYAGANNTGVRHARGRVLLLLNSDVVPITAGWLQTLLGALETEEDMPVGIVGPKLLFDDGSLQHAGLTFARDQDGRWYNTHYFKGYPRLWPDACVPRSVPAVTGAAMLVPRRIYEEVGGFTEDYIVGDYEDSDLCLKVRALGFDIRYEPRAELHHFERRSIRLHAGYVRTAASTYNRRLHAGRWSATMADLVQRYDGDAPDAAGRGR